MKLLLFICFLLLFSWLGNSNKKIISTASRSATEIKDTIDFSKQIQPILVSHCSPCHFPGGKMYQRLPFDKDTTIINHEAGILRIIKGDDNALIKAFVQQHN
jgi:hypothetical protein